MWVKLSQTVTSYELKISTLLKGIQQTGQLITLADLLLPIQEIKKPSLSKSEKTFLPPEWTNLSFGIACINVLPPPVKSCHHV